MHIRIEQVRQHLEELPLSPSLAKAGLNSRRKDTVGIKKKSTSKRSWNPVFPLLHALSGSAASSDRPNGRLRILK